MTKKKQPAAPWGNRIIGHGVVAAGQFLANPANWRVHPTEQQDAIDAVLSEVGFVAEAIVNRRSDAEWGRDRGVETLIDGHLRVSRALARGEETPVPVTYVDLRPAEERRVLLTLDPIGAMAVADREKLDALKNDSAVDFPDSPLDLEALFKKDRKQRVSFDASTATNVLVQCSNSEEQAELIEEMKKRGYECVPSARAL